MNPWMYPLRGVLVLSLLCFSAHAQERHPQIPLPPVATFSIVAFDPVAQEWGVTVASRYFSVGSVVPWAEAGTGAIATQANVNVGYGPRGLELLRQGLSAKQVLEKLMAEDTFDGKDGRQVAIIDGKGGIATYTGPAANKWAGDRQGKTWVGAGQHPHGGAGDRGHGQSLRGNRRRPRREVVRGAQSRRCRRRRFARPPVGVDDHR